MSVKIKLDNFEGPFDLLFHLIEKNEVNIYDIPIAKITKQYLSYIQEMINLDLEVASEFLVMAATLLAIKARTLLPKAPKLQEEEEVQEDPRTELVEKLLEYKKYKAASEFLRQRAGQAAQAIPRQDESEYFISLFGEPELTGVTLMQISDAFAKILAKLDKIPDVIRLKKRFITVSDKMHEIIQKLEQGNHFSFEELFILPASRMEVVITFLAVLELIRLRKILVKQKDAFGDIYIFKRLEEVEG